MISHIVKATLINIIPKAVTDIYNHFFIPHIKEIPTVKSKRKASDTTKFTQYQYDFIKEQYFFWCNNPERVTAYGTYCKTQHDLAKEFNELLSLNKSRSTYQHIFSGRLDKSTLPKGEPVFLSLARKINS